MNLQPTTYKLQAKPGFTPLEVAAPRSSGLAMKSRARLLTGFTLIESLVAITVLLIGVLGPMTVATRGISDGFYAQNQLIGTHLAQEGLDLLSAQIQNNYINRDVFLTGLDNCLTSSPNSPCAVGALAVTGPISFPSCSNVGDGDCQIAYHPTSGFYKDYVVSSSMDFSGLVFTRTLTVDELTSTSPIEVLLRSKVEWKNKSTDPTFKVVELFRYAFEK